MLKTHIKFLKRKVAIPVQLWFQREHVPFPETCP